MGLNTRGWEMVRTLSIHDISNWGDSDTPAAGDEEVLISMNDFEVNKTSENELVR